MSFILSCSEYRMPGRYCICWHLSRRERHRKRFSSAVTCFRTSPAHIFTGSTTATLFAHMTKQITRVWSFASDSNPNIEYQTLQYADGSTSCNCKGWTRRVAPDGSRSCKHTRLVDMGTADRTCKATHSYEHQQPQPSTKGIHHANHHTFQIPKLGHRKFAI